MAIRKSNDTTANRMVLRNIMQIVLAYTVVSQGPLAPEYVSRFVGSWIVNPPGVDCNLVAVCNGAPPSPEIAFMLEPLNAQFFPRVNDDGWDLGGAQAAARKFPCEIFVQMGESCYFHKPNWLRPIVDAWKRFGAGMYGFFSSFLVRPHLNTTAFACDPKFLMGWPKIDNHTARYNFEHGKFAFWNHMQNFRKPTKLVTWDGTYDPPQWRYPQNILWRGDQSNLLIFCNHVDRYFAADPKTKHQWAYAADHGGPKR